jgi:hypothetical protein
MENVKELTVGELRDLYMSGEFDIDIDTPDGFQPITKWFDKGPLPMVEIKTESGLTTRCAVNHMLQLSSGEWITAGSASTDLSVITKNSSDDQIVEVNDLEDAECYDFTVDHPNHRYWGDGFSSHNSGKSFLCSGNLVRHAQQAGIYPILIDTENALDETWLRALGVDTSEDKLLKVNMAMIDDVAKMISEFVKEYRTLSETERPKVLFIIDSLGMLLTPTDVNQFEAGDLKGDMGRKPKALTALVRNCVNMFGSLNIGLVATNHTYASQDMFDPDDKISGGCLTAGHKVWMADGSSKNIEDIEVGDVVVTLDGDIDVSETFRFDDKEVFEVELDHGEVIQATGQHKFLTLSEDNSLVWKTLDELSTDDEILRVV